MCWLAPIAPISLRLLGADVIKVEQPEGGDLARQLGASPELNAAGMGASFLAQNAGKRSVVLDLKKDADRARFLDLVAHRRRAGRELPPGSHEPSGARVRRAEEGPTGIGLLRDLRLWPNRSDAGQSGLRPDHPGPFRDHEHHRNARDGAVYGLATRSRTRSGDCLEPLR